MANFASSEQAKMAAGEVQDEEISVKTESRRLNTTEVTSMFNLRSELLKKKTSTVKSSLDREYALKGKSSVLTVSKEEKEQAKREKQQRRSNISEMERRMQKDEEEALAKSQQRLKEKEMLYEKLKNGTVLTHTDDSPVEFLVDFAQKSREEPQPNMVGPQPQKAGPQHYVPNEEQRVYGTSHVIFSQEEETRMQEINRLKNLSKETEAARLKQKKVMDEKERLRLEKTNRLRRQHGLPEIKPPTPPPEEPGPSVSDIPLPEDKPSYVQEASFEEQTQKRIRSDREWDRGKANYTVWLEKQREEREDEFRPPDSYYR